MRPHSLPAAPSWDPLTGLRLRCGSSLSSDRVEPASAPPTTQRPSGSSCELAEYRALLAAKGAAPTGAAATGQSFAEEEAMLRHSRRLYDNLIRQRAALTFLRRSRQTLTEGERVAAESALNNSPSNQVLAEWFNIQLTPRVLQCLRPGDWLNDEVINVYMSLLNARNTRLRDAGHDVPKSFCWNTFFWTKLVGEEGQGYDYTQVKRWTKKRKIDVFELDLMIVPVNLRKVHWALGLVDFRVSRVSFLDSLAGTVAPAEFFDGIRRYLADEHLDKKSQPFATADQWCLDNSAYLPIPQQSNGSDCGVFTCQFAECVTDGRFLDVSQSQIPDRRLKMVAQLCKGEVM